jgi:hypothetical protein
LHAKHLNFGIFDIFKAIGVFYGGEVYFAVYIFPIWYIVPREIWQPCAQGWNEIKAIINVVMVRIIIASTGGCVHNYIVLLKKVLFRLFLYATSFSKKNCVIW